MPVLDQCLSINRLEQPIGDEKIDLCDKAWSSPDSKSGNDNYLSQRHDFIIKNTILLYYRICHSCHLKDVGVCGLGYWTTDWASKPNDRFFSILSQNLMISISIVLQGGKQ